MTGRDAAPVVDDGHAAIDVDRDLDHFSETRHMFIDAVVDDLVDEMVQTIDAGTADVHGRTFPDGIQAFEHLNLVRTVFLSSGSIAVAGRTGGLINSRRIGLHGQLIVVLTFDSRHSVM